MKVGIIGAGAVGSACLLSMVMRGSAREVVLVNRNRKRARGVVTDVQYGAVLSPPVAVRDGDYSDLAGSSVVMITAESTRNVEAQPIAAILSEGSACSMRMLQSFRTSSRRSTTPLPTR